MVSASHADALQLGQLVGDWTVSVARSGAIQLARLEIRERSGGLEAALSSELGDSPIREAKIERGSLLLRYEVAMGDGSETVRLDLQPRDGGLEGTVATGDTANAMKWPVRAAKVGTPLETALLAEHASTQSSAPGGVAGLAAEEARGLLGNWELSIGRADLENGPRFKMGLIIADVGGKVAVGVKLMDAPQRTIYGVSKIENGLRVTYELQMGVTIPADMDLVTKADRLAVTVTPPGQPTFLSGTGIRRESGEAIGMDPSVIALQPHLELMGMIDNGRVVSVQDEVVFLQEGVFYKEATPLTSLNVTDPLLVRFPRGRIPENCKVLSINGSRISVVNIGTRTLEVYEVPDSDTTIPVGACDIPSKLPNDYLADGSLVFAVGDNGRDSTHRIHVMDVSRRSGPLVLSSSDPITGAGVYAIHASGSHLLIGTANYLSIVDVSDPRSPKPVSLFRGRIGAQRGVDVVGSTAYVASSLHADASRLQLVDVSDPTSPAEVSVFTTGGGAQDVAVSGSFAFVADRSNGIVVVDVSDPAKLKQCGFFRTAGHANKVTLAGELVFVTVSDMTEKLAILRHDLR
jgi:hypothetical protein